MEFRFKHAFGIVVGVVVTIVAANALNLLFNWEVMAVVCGLLLGLEAGFWSGVPELTYRVHKEAAAVMFSNKFWHIIFEVVKPIVYYSTALAGICLAVYVAFKAGMWMGGKQPWLCWLFPNKDPTYTPMTDIEGRTALLAFAFSAFLSILAQIRLFDDLFCKNNRWWRCSAVHIPMGLAIGLAVGLAMYPALLLLGAALCLCAATVALVLGVVGLKCLVVMAGKHEAMAITVGVVIGGLGGLCYGRWTQLAFEPTSLSIMVGSAAGLASAYAMHRLGRAGWFIRLGKAEEPITSTTS